MAEVNIKTRLSLRYDTLANWNSANPVLNKGEVAVVAIPSTATGNDTYGQDTKPSILFKVGDGTSNFKALPYASGRAADVYAWAKAATKPTYTASEVGAAEEGHIHTGDEIYIGGHDTDTLEDWAQTIAANVDSRALSSDVYTKSQVDTKIKEIQGALEADTNTQYKLEWNTSEKLLILSSKDIGGNWEVVTKLTPGQFTLSSAAGTELSGKTFDEVISGLSTKVNGLEQDLETYYATKDNLNQAIDDIEVGLANGAVQVYAAGRAAKDGAGNTITETYATKTELSNSSSNLQGLIHDLEGITQTLDGYFTSEGVALEAVEATKDGAGNVIATTYATKTELGKKLDSSRVVQEVTSSTSQDALVQWSGLELYIAKQDKALQDAIGAAEERASDFAIQEASSAAEGAVSPLLTGTKTVKKAEQDGNGNVISSTYATKTEMNNVSAIANGKTKTFVTSKTNKDSSYNNSVFNTQNADITITPSSKILLIDGSSHLVISDLKLGDIILVKETDVPDRWVSAVSSSSVTLSKMETSKVDLSSYVLKSTIINGKELTADIELTGDDIKVSNANNTSISDKFDEVDEYIADFVSGDKAVAHAEFADSADKATKDGNGNVIKDTYATKEALNTLGTAFESVEWALFTLSPSGKVSIHTESTKINAKLNEYMSNMSTNDLQGAQIIERGLKFVMVDPTDIRWLGHISCFDVDRGLLSIKFECDSLDTISPFNGYDITIAYKSGVVMDTVLEKRFNPSDVYILNGGNAAGAYN